MSEHRLFLNADERAAIRDAGSNASGVSLQIGQAGEFYAPRNYRPILCSDLGKFTVANDPGAFCVLDHAAASIISAAAGECGGQA